MYSDMTANKEANLSTYSAAAVVALVLGISLLIAPDAKGAIGFLLSIAGTAVLASTLAPSPIVTVKSVVASLVASPAAASPAAVNPAPAIANPAVVIDAASPAAANPAAANPAAASPAAVIDALKNAINSDVANFRPEHRGAIFRALARSGAKQALESLTTNNSTMDTFVKLMELAQQADLANVDAQEDLMDDYMESAQAINTFDRTDGY